VFYTISHSISSLLRKRRLLKLHSICCGFFGVQQIERRQQIYDKSKWWSPSIYQFCWADNNFHSATILIFTARCYASAVLAMGLCLSVSVSVCPSVTSRSSTKTAKRRITQTTPHDSPGTLIVFWCQRSPRNSIGVTPYEGAECRWVVKIGDFRQITGYMSKTVKDRYIVSIKVE